MRRQLNVWIRENSLVVALGLAIFVMFFKFSMIVADYRYILPNFDSAYIMEHIQWLIYHGKVHFAAISVSRPALDYLTAAIRFVTGISTVDTLLIPTLIASLISVFLVKILAEEIAGDKNIAYLSSLLFALAISFVQLNTIYYYAFLFVPWFFIVLLKYFRGDTNWFWLFLTLTATNLAYSRMTFLIVGLTSVWVFFKLLVAVRKGEEQNIKRCGNFCLAALLSVSAIYLAVQPLFFPYNQGIRAFLWQFVGLGRMSSMMTDKIFLLLYAYFVILFLLFLARFYWKRLQFIKKIDGTVWKNFRNKFLFSRSTKRSLILMIFALLLFLEAVIILDLWRIAVEIFYKQILARPFFFLSNELLQGLIHSDFWDLQQVGLLPYLILTVIFLVSLLSKKITLKKGAELIVWQLVFLFLAVVFWFDRAFVVDITGFRSIISLAPLLAIAAAIVMLKMRQQFVSLNIQLLLIGVPVLYLSIMAMTYAGSNFVPPDFIEAMRWFEKNKKSDSYVYINKYAPVEYSPYLLDPENSDYVTYRCEKRYQYICHNYYTYSFFISSVPAEVNYFLNQKDLLDENFDEFKRRLKNVPVIDYVILDRYLNGITYRRMLEFSDLVFWNSEIRIYRIDPAKVKLVQN